MWENPPSGLHGTHTKNTMKSWSMFDRLLVVRSLWREPSIHGDEDPLARTHTRAWADTRSH